MSNAKVVPRVLLHLLWVFKPNLTGRHTTIFLQIGPWCVYDGDVVFFVT